MRNSYIVDTFTLVVIHGTVETGGVVIKTYEGVIHRKDFKINPFWKAF